MTTATLTTNLIDQTPAVRLAGLPGQPEWAHTTLHDAGAVLWAARVGNGAVVVDQWAMPHPETGWLICQPVVTLGSDETLTRADAEALAEHLSTALGILGAADTATAELSYRDDVLPLM